MDKKINDFVVFCLEVYKSKHKLTGEEAYELFEKYKVFDYLEGGNDILHTQGDAWLMNHIEEFLKIRGYEEK